MLARVCCLSSSVTLPAGGRPGRRARGRSGSRQCTAGQYGYVPLGRHLVTDRVSRKGNAIGRVRPSVRLFPLYFERIDLRS